MSDEKFTRTTTPEEQQAAYDRARKIIEQVLPKLRSSDAPDEFTALQLLMVRSALRIGLNPEQLLGVLGVNLPKMYLMWEQGDVDVKEGYRGPPNNA